MWLSGHILNLLLERPKMTVKIPEKKPRKQVEEASERSFLPAKMPCLPVVLALSETSVTKSIYDRNAG